MENKNLPAPSLRVICCKNGANSKIFTNGKVYDAFKPVAMRHCKTWVIVDDFGNELVILPDQLCPHLVKETYSPYGYGQECAGMFKTVK